MIEYLFTFSDDRTWAYSIDETQALPEHESPETAPDWMLLKNNRCSVCSLGQDRKLCPAAQAIAPVVDTFAARISYEDLDMQVQLRGLEIHAKTQAQEALRSLIGLLLPLSDCPVMRKLRPMARFHEPLASPQQTVFRVFGMYLVEQFLRSRDGQEPEWELKGLLELYQHIHEVNVKLAERLRMISSADANINGLTLLDVLAHAVDFGFESSEEQLRVLFAESNTGQQL